MLSSISFKINKYLMNVHGFICSIVPYLFFSRRTFEEFNCLSNERRDFVDTSWEGEQMSAGHSHLQL